MNGQQAALEDRENMWTASATRGGVVRAIRRFAQASPVSAFFSAVLLLVVLGAIFANQVAPYDPLEGDYSAIRQTPSAAHLLGTDHQGRDLLSRVIHGARISLVVGFASAGLGDLLGLLWGVSAGYLGRRFDLISQRLLEIMMSIPTLILATLLMMALGPGLHTIIVAIAVTRIPASTRVIRSVALSVKGLAYIDAARAMGASPLRIMVRHIAPQCVAPFLVIASAHLGVAITTEAALSFMGVGIPPPAPSWGTMLGGVTSAVLTPPWWLAVFPGAAITLTVLSVNIVGDTVRDLLDPKMKGHLD